MARSSKLDKRLNKRLDKRLDVQRFRRSLLGWFESHARDLPWRRSGDPYAIWISEIMLQQTRVAAILPHYARFISRFPTIAALAVAGEDEVLSVWSGLGYYRRARFLHRAARMVVAEHQGALPKCAEDLGKLPGIGAYTAAAIASIAFGEPVAAVDGNVQRVILRVFSGSGPEFSGAALSRWFRDRAGELLEPSRAGAFNQAMMELGATVCLPKNPLCLDCPVRDFCLTQGEHPVIPRKSMLSREIAYGLFRRGSADAGKILLERRPNSAAKMPGMWELPEIALEKGDLEHVQLALRHSITVTNYYVRVVRLGEEDADSRLLDPASERRWMNATEAGELPLTGLTRKVLRRLKITPMAQAY